MAPRVFLSEYGASTNRMVQALQAPALVMQPPITASTVTPLSFAPFSGATEVVRINVDGGGPVCIKIGPHAFATPNDDRWAPNQTETRVVRPGDICSVLWSPT